MNHCNYRYQQQAKKADKLELKSTESWLGISSLIPREHSYSRYERWHLSRSFGLYAEQGKPVYLFKDGSKPAVKQC